MLFGCDCLTPRLLGLLGAFASLAWLLLQLFLVLLLLLCSAALLHRICIARRLLPRLLPRACGVRCQLRLKSSDDNRKLLPTPSCPLPLSPFPYPFHTSPAPLGARFGLSAWQMDCPQLGVKFICKLCVCVNCSWVCCLLYCLPVPPPHQAAPCSHLLRIYVCSRCCLPSLELIKQLNLQLNQRSAGRKY